MFEFTAIKASQYGVIQCATPPELKVCMPSMDKLPIEFVALIKHQNTLLKCQMGIATTHQPLRLCHA